MRGARALWAGFLCLVAGCAGLPGGAPPPAPMDRAVVARLDLPAMKVYRHARPEAPRLSNVDLARDFLDLSFRMESGRALPMMTRFTGPATVTMVGPAPPTASADLDRLLARLRAEAGIRVHRAAPGAAASITVVFLPRRKMQALAPLAACFVVPNVASWDEFRRARRSPRTDWATLKVRTRMGVFIPDDISPQEVRDCLHEEIAQAFGPINDLYRLTDSVFNDDNFHSVLTGFDMLMLRLYQALPNGTTRAEAAARLPGLLARLNPRGRHIAPRPAPGPTPRAWTEAIEAALGPRESPLARRMAAARAVAIARDQGWGGARMAFSWFVLGRLALDDEPLTAVHAFEAARALYRRLPDTALQLAQIDMQLAAWDLMRGDPAQALIRVARALPAARRDQNAALTATLLVLKADALEAQGQTGAARVARLDSLGWARYGFGTMRAVLAAGRAARAVAADAPVNDTQGVGKARATRAANGG